MRWELVIRCIAHSRSWQALNESRQALGTTLPRRLCSATADRLDALIIERLTSSTLWLNRDQGGPVLNASRAAGTRLEVTGVARTREPAREKIASSAVGAAHILVDNSCEQCMYFCDTEGMFGR